MAFLQISAKLLLTEHFLNGRTLASLSHCSFNTMVIIFHLYQNNLLFCETFTDPTTPEPPTMFMMELSFLLWLLDDAPVSPGLLKIQITSHSSQYHQHLLQYQIKLK